MDREVLLLRLAQAEQERAKVSTRFLRRLDGVRHQS